MRDVVIVGTDTDAGKTTAALLILAAFPDRFAYWKPVESGDSDTLKIRRLVPGAHVYDPVARFPDAVAPPLAARRAGSVMPSPRDVARRKPTSEIPLLIETFGSPLSPFTENELQVELVRELRLPIWVASSSSVGAIGRILQCREALRSHGLDAEAVILMGERDDFAAEQIQRHGIQRLIQLRTPSEWTVPGIADAAQSQRQEIETILDTTKDHQCVHPGTDLVARDRHAVWHPYTSLADPIPPLSVVSATDEWLELADGRRILDAISSWWTILHGHRHPRLMQSLRDATDRLDHVLYAGVTHPDSVTLAEKLLRSSPWPDGKVFYSDNGSTAVEVALKLAYQFHCHRGESQRTLFIAFDNSYHGDTFGSMAIGRDPVFFGRFEPFLFKTVRVPLDANRLEEFLAAHHSEVAAVIVEPLVQGAGGMQMHSPDELRALFESARRHSIPFIADEVMTGNRTGTIWAFEQAAIQPDLICTGKTLTGGVLPLAATLVAPEIAEAFNTTDRTRTFFHGHSFTANPLASAVGVANWSIIESGSWKHDVQRIERFWHDRLTPMRNHPGVRDVRIRGTIAAITIDSDGGDLAGYLASIGPIIRQTAIQQGVLLRPLGNVVYAMPPLCTTNSSLELIVQAIRTVIELASHHR